MTEQAAEFAVNIIWVLVLLTTLSVTSAPSLLRLFDYGLRNTQDVSKPKQRPVAASHLLPALPSKAGWTVMYVVAIASSLCGIAFTASKTGSLSSVPLAQHLFLAQASRRLFETRRVSRMTPRPLNPLVLTSAIVFYVMAGASIALASARPCRSARQTAAAVALFAAASATQAHAHFKLATVRPVHGKYGVPRGGLFEYVCCPHYTAEIAVYFSFLALSPGLPTLLLLSFVACNLSVTAVGTRRWYYATFPPAHLPNKWKAILPLLL